MARTGVRGRVEFLHDAIKRDEAAELEPRRLVMYTPLPGRAVRPLQRNLPNGAAAEQIDDGEKNHRADEG